MSNYFERFKRGEIALQFTTKEGWKEFLQRLESETEITWACGENPTNPDCVKYWNEYEEDTYLVCYYGEDIKYDKVGVNKVPLEDYLEVKKSTTESEKLFGTQLDGVFKEAFEVAKEYLDIEEADVEVLEDITKAIQLVAELNSLPIRQELEKAKTELEAQVKANVELDRRIGEAMEENRKLQQENRNLINSLKYLKEVSEKQDLLNDKVDYFKTQYTK